MNAFELKNVWKIYSMNGVKTVALRGINLRIRKSDYIAIVGPSGSRKSTLLHIMGCLDTPTKGRVFVNERDVSNLSDDELAEIRCRSIGFVFQAYNLISTLNVLENVALPARLHGMRKQDAEKKTKELLEMLGLKDGMFHKPSQLSGGQ